METQITNFWRDKLAFTLTGISLLAVGLSLWPIPYEDVQMLQQPFLVTWALIGFTLGALGVLFLKRHPIKSMVCVAFGFVLAVMGRIIVEAIIDPTSHNLWPFEIVIALAVSFPSAFLGAFGSSLLKKSV